MKQDKDIVKYYIIRRKYGGKNADLWLKKHPYKQKKIQNYKKRNIAKKEGP